MSNETEKCWLIQSGSEPAGPYSQAQLQSLARSGRISRSTLIQDLNSLNWLVAGQLPELFQQVVPTTKVADQTKPTQPQATPIRPALPASPAPTSMSPPVPSGFGDKKYFASTQPAIIAAAAAGAVGSAVIGILLFVSLQNAVAKRSGLVEPDLDIATAAPNTSASTGNADSLTGAAPNHSAVYSTEDLVSRTQQSVAAVITNQGSDSGFMVGPSVMATNYHVIADSLSNEIAVVFPDGEETKQGPFQAMIIAEQPDRDLALLRIEAEIPTLDVYPDYRFRRGQDIIIRRRHIAIESLLQSPTGDLERFVNQLGSLDNDFFDNLADVNNILEIGRPELLSK